MAEQPSTFTWTAVEKPLRDPDIHIEYECRNLNLCVLCGLLLPFSEPSGGNGSAVLDA